MTRTQLQSERAVHASKQPESQRPGSLPSPTLRELTPRTTRMTRPPVASDTDTRARRNETAVGKTTTLATILGRRNVAGTSDTILIVSPTTTASRPATRARVDDCFRRQVCDNSLKTSLTNPSYKTISNSQRQLIQPPPSE